MYDLLIDYFWKLEFKLYYTIFQQEDVQLQPCEFGRHLTQIRHQLNCAVISHPATHGITSRKVKMLVLAL